jgi:hypothetical protein
MKWNVLFGTLVLSLGLCAHSFGFELLDRMLGVGGKGCDPCSVKGGCDPKCGVDPKCGASQKSDPKCGASQKGDPKCGASQKGDPKCGASQKGDPKCGASQKGDPKCGASQKGDPKCGASQKGDPKCGVDPKCGASQKGCGLGLGQRHLLDGLFACNRCDKCEGKGGDPKCGADPKCGVDPKCGASQKGDPKCGDPKKGCGLGGSHRPLLEALFGCGNGNACGKGGKGCEDPGCDDPCDGGKGGKDKAKVSSDKDAPIPPAPVVDPSAFLNTRTVIPASRIVR